MAAFPAAPILLFEGFRQKREAGVIRTPTEGGMVKQRKRFSRTLIERPVAYLLTSAQDYTDFIDWYENTIGRVGWFDWTDPVDQQVKEARIKGGEIEEQPQRKALDRWRITFTIEVWGS